MTLASQERSLKLVQRHVPLDRSHQPGGVEHRFGPRLPESVLGRRFTAEQGRARYLHPRQLRLECWIQVLDDTARIDDLVRA